jgi:hypothetical protein
MFVKTAPVEMFDDMLKAWQDLPRLDGAKIPGKKAFNPAALSKYLQNIGLAEHVGDGKLIIRLAGTNSREFWGEEVTGSDYHKLPGVTSEEVMVPPMIIESVLNQPCGMRSLREAEDTEGYTWKCDMFSLPFSGDSSESKFLLYGYRIYPKDESQPQAWEPGLADLSTARLVAAEFVDLGFGVPA